VNVITPVGFDHQAILGQTIAEIASEKAGIIRPHATCVIAPQPQEWSATVMNVMAERVSEVGGRQVLEAGDLVHCVPFSCAMNAAGSGPGSRARFSVGPDTPWSIHSSLCRDLQEGVVLEPALPGFHQLDNVRTALAVLIALESVGTVVGGVPVRVPSAAVQQGVRTVDWPGRFEVLGRQPLVVVDGAHCGLSASALGRTLADFHGDGETILVAGFMRDKAAERICAALKPHVRPVRAICCAPPSPRALDPEKAALIVSASFGLQTSVVAQPADAMQVALRAARSDQAVLAFGSMFLVGPFKEGVDRARRQLDGGPNG
jgi:dihydrofolate synthase/folylpolyglutamate synthase